MGLFEVIPCRLWGHRIKEPTAGVEFCSRCLATRGWQGTPFSTVERVGASRWPFFRAREVLADGRALIARWKERFFCSECGRWRFATGCC
jgi:hypothetical protein